MKPTFATCALILGLSMADAAVIIPTTITFTGTGTEFFTNENNLINGSGLSASLTDLNLGTVTHASVSSGNAWVTTDPGGNGSDYFASTTATIVFEVTFDQTYTVNNFVNWAYNPSALNRNDIRNVTFDYGVGNFTGGTLSNQPLAQASSAGGSVITAVGGFTADRVRITVNDNYFGAGTGAGGDRVGLSEIVFQGTAVPEPSSALLGGLGMLALLRRRR